MHITLKVLPTWPDIQKTMIKDKEVNSTSIDPFDWWKRKMQIRLDYVEFDKAYTGQKKNSIIFKRNKKIWNFHKKISLLLDNIKK